MSWFWGRNAKGSDPTKSLDPDLKDFLDKQQPKPYVPSEPARPDTTKATLQPQANPVPAAVEPSERPLPKESLFQDGRYKHLWKTYVPQTENVAQTTSSAERVITAKKDRRESIHRAALENCAFEEEMQHDCLISGDVLDRVRARMTMCRQETKAFNRCYQLQAKFLQALGYLSSPHSTSADDEHVQMHADKLYHRMMDYEAAVDEAKKNNTPIPPLSSVFNPRRSAPTVEQINLPPNMEKLLKKPLQELPPHERELAARAVLSEAKVAQNYADEMFKYTTTLNDERKGRQKALVNVFGEVIGKYLIPDAPEEHKVTKYDNSQLDRDIWNEDSNSSK